MKATDKTTMYFVVWCNQVDTYHKFKEMWDCFYSYEDAKQMYNKLSNRPKIENLKLTKVIEEENLGVIQQEYYA
jgi:hypothetical protein